MLVTITIPNDSQDKAHLQKEISRIKKKLDKNAQIAAIFEKPHTEQLNGQTYELVKVWVTCTDVNVNNCTVFAKIEHTTAGNIISQWQNHEIDTSPFFHVGSNCDICNHNRRRLVTYLAQNETTGEIVQVGSSCMKDISHLTAVLRLWELVQEFQQDEPEDMIRFFNMRPVLKTTKVIELALGCIQEFGYTSRKNATFEQIPTAEIMSDVLADPEDYRNVTFPSQHTDEIITSWNNFAGTTSSFNHSLSVIANLENVTKKNFGLIAAGVSFWWTAKNKVDEDEKLNFSSSYFGTEEKRYNGMEATLVKAKFGAFTKPGYSGYDPEIVINIYTFINDDGQALVIFANDDAQYNSALINENDDTAHIGRRYSFNAKVKSHKEYNGVLQTVLQRPTKFKVVD